MASHKIFTLRAPGGFTMLEVLIVMSLIIIIAGMGLFFSFDEYRGYSFRTERDVVVSVIQKSRSQAINNMCFGVSCTDGKPHGVYFGIPHHYIIFQGSSYASRDAAVDEDIEARDDAASVAGASSMVFAQLSGVVSGTATITVTDPSGHSSTVTVEPEGRIWWTQ